MGSDGALHGYGALQRRLAAVGQATEGRPLMRALGLLAEGEAKARVHRKTGNLQRSIHVTNVTDTSVKVEAQAKYAAPVEHGSKPHEIRPRSKKALRWAGSPANRRLTGSPRSGTPAGGFSFAKVVHHPGTKPYPFLRPGAEAAIQKAGLGKRIVSAWNTARAAK